MLKIKRTETMDCCINEDGEVLWRTPRVTYGAIRGKKQDWSEAIETESGLSEDYNDEFPDDSLSNIGYDEEGDILYQV